MISANVTKKTRKSVYAREGYRCAVCDSTKYLQVHHCVKRSQGGTNSVQNLICLCADCLAHGINLNGWDATQRDMEQAVTEYLADFYAPDWNPWGKGGPPRPPCRFKGTDCFSDHCSPGTCELYRPVILSDDAQQGLRADTIIGRPAPEHVAPQGVRK